MTTSHSTTGLTFWQGAPVGTCRNIHDCTSTGSHCPRSCPQDIPRTSTRGLTGSSTISTIRHVTTFLLQLTKDQTVHPSSPSCCRSECNHSRWQGMSHLSFDITLQSTSSLIRTMSIVSVSVRFADPASLPLFL